jgi:hypothetical protein
MSRMHEASELQEMLAEVCEDFEFCARQAIECLSNQPTLMSKIPWVEPASQAEWDIRCVITASNGDYAVEVALGLANGDLAVLFPSEKDNGMGLDAIGEMVNIMAGCLFNRPGFNSRFGCLRASTPRLVAGPKAGADTWSLLGEVAVASARLCLELTVIPTGNREPK